MADTPPLPSSSSEASAPPSSAAEQARIRKERREAKIRAGGSARLNKITGLGGGVQRDPPPQPTISSHADPEEVDISQHYYEPQRASRPNINASPSPSPASQQGMNEDALRQMMLGFDPAAAQGAGPGGAPPNPFANMMGGMDGMYGGPQGDDPIMKMMQQMMGGMPGEGSQGMPSFPGMPGQPVAATTDPYAYIWRIVHAVFALGLGLYIAFTTTFTGTRIDRERSALGYSSADEGIMNQASVHLFWIFATVEVVLQSSRFLLENGRVQQGGIMGMITDFLPEPYKGYLLWFSRYSRIWTTVSSDAMVCIFVLGACAWWKGN